MENATRFAWACCVSTSSVCLKYVCTYMTHSNVPGMEDPLDLVPIVAESVNRLRDKDIKVQEKGVNALAALAQTGEPLHYVL